MTLRISLRSCVSGSYRINTNKVKGCGFGCSPVTSCLNTVVPDKYLKVNTIDLNLWTIIYIIEEVHHN